MIPESSTLPMTTQERINQLAEAALRAAPPTKAIPRPVTFMPSFEKLRSQEFVAPAHVAAPLAPAPVAPALHDHPAGTGSEVSALQPLPVGLPSGQA